MSYTVTVTPGRLLQPGEKVTNAVLNQMAAPTAAISGTGVENGEVTPVKTKFEGTATTFGGALRTAGKVPASDLVLGGGLLIDARFFGAIGDGASHPLSGSYGTLALAQAVFPHATSLTEETDWAAIQAALNAAGALIQATMAGSGTAKVKTLPSRAATVVIPAGLYVVNRELKVYPHTNLRGMGSGSSVIMLGSGGYAATTAAMTLSGSGLWVGAFSGKSCLLWLMKTQTSPAAANQYCEVADLGLRCWEGAAVFAELAVDQLHRIVAGFGFEHGNLAPIAGIPVQEKGADPTDTLPGLERAGGPHEVHLQRTLDVGGGVGGRGNSQRSIR